MYYYDDDFLEHHGIVGMKWGVRRFQNKDGGLTPAGRVRRGLKKTGSALAGGGKALGKKTAKAGVTTAKFLKSVPGKLKKHHDERVEKAIEKAIQEGDGSTLAKYKSRMSTKQLDEANKRMESMYKLAASTGDKFKWSIKHPFDTVGKQQARLQDAIQRGDSQYLEKHFSNLSDKDLARAKGRMATLADIQERAEEARKNSLGGKVEEAAKTVGKAGLKASVAGAKTAAKVAASGIKIGAKAASKGLKGAKEFMGSGEGAFDFIGGKEHHPHLRKAFTKTLPEVKRAAAKTREADKQRWRRIIENYGDIKYDPYQIYRNGF